MAFDTLRFRAFGRLAMLLSAICALGGSAWGQTCVFNGTNLPAHAEGYAERIGDITVSCTGGTVGATVSLTMFVSLNATITNRLDANGDPTGITFTGPGVTVGSLRVTSPTNLSMSAVNYTVTLAPVVMTLTGLRAAIAPLPTPVVNASFVGIGATFNTGAQLPLATGVPTLLSSALSNGVPCGGSALPTTLDFATFASTSTSSTIRVTEAAVGAFATKLAADDSGTRIIVKLTGYGSGVRVFVPDAIVGNSGTVPTATGAFNTTVNSGTYTPAANQLLLARVASPDANGAGGSLAFAAPVGITTFSTMTELTVINGAAQVVYEVLDGNPAVQESAHVPVFVVVPTTTCPSALVPTLTATLGPVSTVATATRADAIPRFAAATAGSDCSVLSDCNAPYYPKLSVDQTPISLSGTSLGDTRSATVRVGNTGSGILPWTTSISYVSDANWLSISPATGTNNATLQVIADSSKLAEGTYAAIITVSAGTYGSAQIPVTFTVGPVGVVVQNVGNAASFQYGTVAPGSYAVLYGLNMGGTNVSVSFNGLAASLVYTSATQINLIVPAVLAGQQAAGVIVTVDGKVSNTFRVTLVPNAPGVFNPGIVNFTGGQVNTVTNPAARGDIILVFLTGLATPVTGQVTVNIGTLTNLIPAYAGPQGTLPALNQVNITVPAGLPATPNPVPVQVCIPNSVGQQACSNSVNLYIK